MTQSDERITSRLCSMTSNEWPAAINLRNASQQSRHVVEVQTGGRLIEHEQGSAATVGASRRGFVR